MKSEIIRSIGGITRPSDGVSEKDLVCMVYKKEKENLSKEKKFKT